MRWCAAWWSFGEQLLFGANGSPANSIDDVIDTAGASIITLVPDMEMTGLFAQDLKDTEQERALKAWMKNVNRNNKWTVWTVADDEDLNTIRRYHKGSDVITALIKHDRTWKGKWVKCSIARQALDRMKREME